MTLAVLNSTPVMSIEPAFSASYPFAFILGLVSSLHCLTMCGSIIGTLTLSLQQEIRQNKSRLTTFVLSYNLGRILSYSLAGLIAGILQHVLTMPFGDGQGHRFLQLISALFMAGAGLYIAGWFPRYAYIEKLGSKLWRKIEPYGRRLLPVSSLKQAFIFGAIWGWLPCGLVYAALAVATTSGDMFRSALTMLAFGLGTLPAVLGTGIMANMLTGLISKPWTRRLAGILLIVIAVVAIIPAASPELHHH